jgi:hypothetical protein
MKVYGWVSKIEQVIGPHRLGVAATVPAEFVGAAKLLV